MQKSHTITAEENHIAKNIVVISTIVKRIDVEKYRYFFNIKNNDTIPFEGNIYVMLKDLDDITTGGEIFSTKKSIKPGLISSNYINRRKGPISIDPYGTAK